MRVLRMLFASMIGFHTNGNSVARDLKYMIDDFRSAIVELKS